MHTRVVEPELLEALPDDHPDAICARQDLLLVNGIMGNHRWIERTLRQHFQPGWRITEIGAGDGALSRRLWQSRLCEARDLHAFDLATQPLAWPVGAVWTRGDLFHHPLPDTEVLLANLFLHHFELPQLRLLGRRLAPRTQLFLAAEPARYHIHSLLGRLLCALTGLHPVTCYDMQVSIRAGFQGEELRRSLGLGPEWTCTAEARPFGSYRFIARRTD